MPSSSVRVRFAPSPTGYLHVGGARTALFNWLFARHLGGSFILRIEDTDEARNTEPAMRAIFDGLRWLGLDWDEGPDAGGDHGPYFQSQRRGIYDSYLQRLEAAGRVYEDNGAIRFRFSREPITFSDLICGDITFQVTEPDMTIRRPDGGYIFHFVNVVDDIEMRMTHVIRGEDHISNTWKHIDLYRAFGAEPPRFGHIPLILNPGGSKMSKRDEGASMASYIEAGFLPAAVFNYLCLLGWTPRLPGEVFSLEDAVRVFDLAEIHHSNARFDMAKCTWLNQQHLRNLSGPELLKQARPWLTEAGLPLNGFNEDYLIKALQIVREKVSSLRDFPAWIDYFLKDRIEYNDEARQKLNLEADAGAKEKTLRLLNALEDRLAILQHWDAAQLSAALNEVAAQMPIKVGAMMPLLRATLSGKMQGPDVKSMMELLGKEKVGQRILNAQKTLVAAIGRDNLPPEFQSLKDL